MPKINDSYDQVFGISMAIYTQDNDRTIEIKAKELIALAQAKQNSLIIYSEVDQSKLSHFVLIRVHNEMRRYAVQREETAEEKYIVSKQYAILDLFFSIEKVIESDLSDVPELVDKTFLPNMLPFFDRRQDQKSDPPLTDEQKKYFHETALSCVCRADLNSIGSFKTALSECLGRFSNQNKRNLFLKACISLNHPYFIAPTKLGYYERCEVFRMRYFLAPNNINWFEYTLPGNKPTIGMIYSYFIECIQQHLGPINQVPYNELTICLFSEKLRQTPIGSETIECDDNTVSNSEGLSTSEHHILSCLQAVCESADPSPEKLRQLLWNNPDYYQLRADLKKIFYDLKHNRDQHTCSEYFQIYSWFKRYLEDRPGIDVSTHIINAWHASTDFLSLQDMIRQSKALEAKKLLLGKLEKLINEPQLVNRETIPFVLNGLEQPEDKRNFLLGLDPSIASIFHEDEAHLIVKNILESLEEESWPTFLAMLSVMKCISKINLPELLLELNERQWQVFFDALSSEDLKFLFSSKEKIENIIKELPDDLKNQLVPALIANRNLRSLVHDKKILITLLTHASPSNQKRLIEALGQAPLFQIMREEGALESMLVLSPDTAVISLLDLLTAAWIKDKIKTGKQLGKLFYHLSPKNWHKFHELFDSESIAQALKDINQLSDFLKEIHFSYHASKELMADLKYILALKLTPIPGKEVDMIIQSHADFLNLLSSMNQRYRPILFSIFESYGLNERFIQNDEQAHAVWQLDPNADTLTAEQRELRKKHARRIIQSILEQYAQSPQGNGLNILHKLKVFFQNSGLTSEKHHQCSVLLENIKKDPTENGSVKALSELLEDAQFVNDVLEQEKILSITKGTFIAILKRAQNALPPMTTQEKKTKTPIAHAQSMEYARRLILAQNLIKDMSVSGETNPRDSVLGRIVSEAEYLLETVPAITSFERLFHPRRKKEEKASKVLLLSRSIQLISQGVDPKTVAATIIDSAQAQPIVQKALAGHVAKRTRRFFAAAAAKPVDRCEKKPETQLYEVKQTLFGPVVQAQAPAIGSVNMSQSSLRDVPFLGGRR